MFERTYRAEGISFGCCPPVNVWPLDPAHELPGRRLPMSVLPPPERSLIQRIAAAVCGLGLVLLANTSLMVLAQYLTTPG